MKNYDILMCIVAALALITVLMNFMSILTSPLSIFSLVLALMVLYQKLAKKR